MPPCGVCLLCGCRWFILNQPLLPNYKSKRGAYIRADTRAVEHTTHWYVRRRLSRRCLQPGAPPALHTLSHKSPCTPLFYIPAPRAVGPPPPPALPALSCRRTCSARSSSWSSRRWLRRSSSTWDAWKTRPVRETRRRDVARWPRREGRALSSICRWRGGPARGRIGRGRWPVVCRTEQHVQKDDGEQHDHGRVQRARLDRPVEQRLDLLPPRARQLAVAPLRRARHRLDGLDERRGQEGRDAVGERHREADLVRGWAWGGAWGLGLGSRLGLASLSGFGLG